MTNLEAIKSTVAGYPLSDDTYDRILTDRGISASGTYAGKTKLFELATADVYTVLGGAANVSEGGYSVSVKDSNYYKAMANAIYSKYSEQTLKQDRIRDKSNLW